jgi:endonuclease YncB( thermonuclease family)
VVDVDILVVLSEGQSQHKIRLAGIDAPETGQPYGRASKSHLSERVAGHFVVADWDNRDRYRIVGKVLLNGADVCLEQIERSGLAREAIPE